MNQYAEDVHAQFGNVRAVKEVASVANQLGRARTLAEGYGAGGWDLRFEDMKRIGDWMYVLGINTLDQHLSYVSLRGARKRDHPQSFSYHEPWWDAYHASADYFARLSRRAVGRRAGERRPRARADDDRVDVQREPARRRRSSRALGKSFQALLVVPREARRWSTTSGPRTSSRATARWRGSRCASAAAPTARSSLPPLTENLNGPTVALLERFLEGGGTVAVGGTATRARRRRARPIAAAALAARPGWTPSTPADLAGAARRTAGQGVHDHPHGRATGGILFHHRRRLGDGPDPVAGEHQRRRALLGDDRRRGARRSSEWDPATGEVSAYPFERDARRRPRLRFDLPQAGSLLLRFTKGDAAGAGSRPGTAAPTVYAVVGADGPPSVRRIGPNVLVLDYVDVRAGGETREKTYFYQASQFAFQKNGVERNPWDSAVQFRDELIARRRSRRRAG